MKLKIKRSKGVYGEIVRHIDSVEGRRLYVKRITSVGVGKSYVLSTAMEMTLDSMVEVAGRYHFRTQQELLATLNK